MDFLVCRGLCWHRKCAEGRQARAGLRNPRSHYRGFFAPEKGKELKNDSDVNEVLSDFQLYYSQASAPLRKAGIDFADTDTLTFKIRIGKKVQRYRMGEIGVGYFFIAPGKKPHIEYGVQTDADLLEAARKYFGIAIR